MDSIFGIGFPELVFIAVIALIILGPERLPGTLREIAKYWGYIRNLSSQLTSQFSEEFKVLNELNPRKLLNEMADEEMAKEAKAKPAPKPATPAKPTTPAKPAAATPAKTAASQPSTSKPGTSNAAAAVATGNPEKPGEVEKTDNPATPSTAATVVENTILPPKAPESSPALPVTNGAVNSSVAAKADAPATEPDLPTNQPVLAGIASTSVNGAQDPAEVAQ